MIPVHPARRRADAFAAAIESPSTAGLDARTVELVGLVGAMRQVAPPEARADFVADLRSRLMVAAETDLVAATPERSVRSSPTARPTTRRDRRIAVALGGMAVVGATSAMAVAAQSALPGDVLYPVKRAIEDADTGLSAREAQGPELLDHASSRLAELDELSRRTSTGDPDVRTIDAIESTLDTFSDQASEGSDILLDDFADNGDEQGVTSLRTFTADSLARLVTLEAELPVDVRPAVLDAAQVLFVIDQAASDACPGCDATGISEIPPSLIVAATLPDRSEDVLTAAIGTPVAPAPDDDAAGRKPDRRSGTATSSGPAAPDAAPTPAATADAPDLPTPTATATATAGAKKTAAGAPKVTTSGGTLPQQVDKLLGRDGSSTPGSTSGQDDAGDIIEGAVEGIGEVVDGLTDPVFTPPS